MHGLRNPVSITMLLAALALAPAARAQITADIGV